MADNKGHGLISTVNDVINAPVMAETTWKSGGIAAQFNVDCSY
jgi:hypothetical protein